MDQLGGAGDLQARAAAGVSAAGERAETDHRRPELFSSGPEDMRHQFADERLVLGQLVLQEALKGRQIAADRSVDLRKIHHGGAGAGGGWRYASATIPYSETRKSSPNNNAQKIRYFSCTAAGLGPCAGVPGARCAIYGSSGAGVGPGGLPSDGFAGLTPAGRLAGGGGGAGS